MRCLQCSLIFVPSEYHLSKENERARYDEHNNDPDDKAYQNFLMKMAKPLNERLKPNWKGLDYGCGPGPAMNRVIKGEGVSLKNYDPFYFPDNELLNDQYDFITCSEAIEHFNSPKKEYQKFDKLLRDGSSILAVMTEVWSNQGRFDQWWYQKDPAHVSFYTRDTFQWISDWLGWDFKFVHKNVVLFNKRA